MGGRGQCVYFLLSHCSINVSYINFIDWYYVFCLLVCYSGSGHGSLTINLDLFTSYYISASFSEIGGSAVGRIISCCRGIPVKFSLYDYKMDFLILGRIICSLIYFAVKILAVFWIVFIWLIFFPHFHSVYFNFWSTFLVEPYCWCYHFSLLSGRDIRAGTISRTDAGERRA